MEYQHPSKGECPDEDSVQLRRQQADSEIQEPCQEAKGPHAA